MLTTRHVLKFWIPLCATWLMMAVEGPVLASVVARMAEPVVNLAAYGVTVALAMFIEAPVIMLLSTSVALARDAQALQLLQRFTHRVNLFVTAGMLLISIPPVYDFVVHGILNVPADVAHAMYWGLVCMIPWPAAIGTRRFAQGVMIRYGRTRSVAIGTLVRLGTMATSSILLWQCTSAPGVVVGTASLTLGVIFEAAATRWMARDSFRTAREQPPSEAPLTLREVVQFYGPLAITSIIGFGVTPMLAFFMNRAPLPLESLAVLPIVDSLVFLFRSFGFSYQEVGVALMGERRSNVAVIRRVGLWIGIATTASIVLLVFTPMLDVVYMHLYGLRAELVDFARLPTMLLIVLPANAVMYSVQRAILVTERRTVAVTISTLVEVGCIATVMTVLIATTTLPGAVAAAAAMSLGRVLASSYLLYQVGKVPALTGTTTTRP